MAALSASTVTVFLWRFAFSPGAGPCLEGFAPPRAIVFNIDHRCGSSLPWRSPAMRVIDIEQASSVCLCVDKRALLSRGFPEPSHRPSIQVVCSTVALNPSGLKLAQGNFRLLGDFRRVCPPSVARRSARRGSDIDRGLCHRGANFAFCEPNLKFPCALRNDINGDLFARATQSNLSALSMAHQCCRLQFDEIHRSKPFPTAYLSPRLIQYCWPTEKDCSPANKR